MKAEKTILTVLCLGVCLWSARMVVGVIGLASTQGALQLLALLEVVTFAGAGLIPLLLLWKRPLTLSRIAIGIWVVCMVYATLLALNLVRVGLYAKGGVRLALWVAIAVLTVRALRVLPRRA